MAPLELYVDRNLPQHEPGGTPTLLVDRNVHDHNPKPSPLLVGHQRGRIEVAQAQGFNRELWDATMRSRTFTGAVMVAGDRGGPRLSPKPWATGETLAGRQAKWFGFWVLPMPRLLGRKVNGLQKVPVLPDAPWSATQNQRVLRPQLKADRPSPAPWESTLTV